MSHNKFLIVISDIEDEIQNLEELKVELEDILGFIDKESPQKHEIRAIGSILHDFYSGIERIFRIISLEVDNNLPKGDSWHRDLLKRMTLETKNIRPQ